MRYEVEVEASAASTYSALAAEQRSEVEAELRHRAKNPAPAAVEASLVVGAFRITLQFEHSQRRVLLTQIRPLA